MAQKIRYVVLDALRGFALLGIILANFPEFSLWTFAGPATHTPLDGVVRGLQFFFIDGKFYTLFSLLFGIGFGIQLENSGHSTTTFYRRMATLFVIGFLHLMLLWSGDILMLYAAMGMLLPLFRRLPTRRLLAVAGSFLLLPLLAESFPLRTRRVGLEDDYLPEEAANAERPRLTRSRPSARTLRGVARLMRIKPSVPYMAPAFTHTL